MNHGGFLRRQAILQRMWRPQSRTVTYLGMDAEILTTGKPNAIKALFLCSLLWSLRAGYTIVHKSLELSQGFFDLGNGT